jgi:hypothetical protein
MNRIHLPLALALLLTSAVMGPAIAQNMDDNPATEVPTHISGTVVSYTESSLVLRTDQGDQMIFALEATTPRPAMLKANDRVRIEYRRDASGSMYASTITPMAAAGTTPSETPASNLDDDAAVSDMDHDADPATPGYQSSAPSSQATPYSSATDRTGLPATAGPLPILGLMGLIGVGTGLIIRRRRARRAQQQL